MPEIKVNLAQNPYSIVIEPGVLARLGEHVQAVAPHARCLLAMDANVGSPHAPHGDVALNSLRDAGFDVVTAALTADEKQKTLGTVQSLYHIMLAAKLDRSSPVIALGGGIVGDIAGLAAATYLRGVPLIQVPTTLLAMVDASIGGKTGVNFPLPPHSGTQDLGKNLIGAFWQPRLVLADPLLLQTLDDRDLRCGLAECIKHGMIADADLLASMDARAEALLARDATALMELIVRSAGIKAAIVAEDERDSGRRALLNLGHTFAHAIEAAAESDIRHGEAVAIGLVAASEVAGEMARMTFQDQEIVIRTLTGCGLPLTLPDRLSAQRLMHAMAFDKKAVAGKLRLVLPRGLGDAEVVDDVPERLIGAAWTTLGAGL